MLVREQGKMRGNLRACPKLFNIFEVDLFVLPLALIYKYLYIASMKLLKFIGSSEDDLSEFPKDSKGSGGT